MIYTNNMSKDVSFSLDPQGGKQILESMAMPTVKRSAEAIAARARGMAGSMSSDPPEITVTAAVGTIKRGTRAIATIRSTGSDPHENYIGYMALTKSRDAGRV